MKTELKIDVWNDFCENFVPFWVSPGEAVPDVDFYEHGITKHSRLIVLKHLEAVFYNLRLLRL